MAREIQRSVLPIPDLPSFGLVTYDDNHDHLIDPEEIVRIAFARQ
jgi:hypothetical protein